MFPVRYTKTGLPLAITPADLTRLRDPFDSEVYVFELKMDGFRALAARHHGRSMAGFPPWKRVHKGQMMADAIGWLSSCYGCEPNGYAWACDRTTDGVFSTPSRMARGLQILARNGRQQQSEIQPPRSVCAHGGCANRGVRDGGAGAAVDHEGGPLGCGTSEGERDKDD